MNVAMSWVAESGPAQTLFAMACVVGFPMLMIVWVTEHVRRRDNRRGICSRCANIRRNKQWVKYGGGHDH